MQRAGRYVKCPLSPIELLGRGLGGLKLRTEAVLESEDQAPDNLAFWNGMDGDDDEAVIFRERKQEERRLTGKASLPGDNDEGDELV